jgi:hypothetical protein
MPEENRGRKNETFSTHSVSDESGN